MLNSLKLMLYLLYKYKQKLNENIQIKNLNVFFENRCFYRKYFVEKTLKSSRRSIKTLTPPQKYPGTKLSFDDQCKSISTAHVYYPSVSAIINYLYT